MKKKLLALALVMAMLLSCMLMLTSCPDSGDGPNGDNGGNQNNGELNLDEGISGSQGSSDLTIITDPNNPEAGKGADGNYIG